MGHLLSVSAQVQFANVNADGQLSKMALIISESNSLTLLSTLNERLAERSGLAFITFAAYTHFASAVSTQC